MTSKAGRLLSRLAAAVAITCVLYACRPGSPGSGEMSAMTRADSTTLRLMIEANRALERRDYALGLVLTDSLLERAPEDADAGFLRGRLLFETGRHEQSEQAFRSVLKAQPAYPGAWHHLGNIYYSRKAYRTALKSYLKETTVHPDVRAWHAAGAAYVKLGIADSARSAFEQAISLRPDYAAGHAALAEWHAAEGDYVNALKHAERASDLAPYNTEYKYLTATYLSATERHPEATLLLEELTQQRPWDHRVFFALGRSLQRDGHAGPAAAALDKAAVLRQKETDINRLRSMSDEMPASFERRVALAEGLRSADRLDDAVREYEVAVAQRPTNVAVLNNLATLYLQTGNDQAALRGFQTVLRQDSTFVEAWLNITLHYMRAGRDRDAQAALARAAQLDPDHPLVARLSESLDRGR